MAGRSPPSFASGSDRRQLTPGTTFIASGERATRPDSPRALWRWMTASNIAGARRPVKVFCSLGSKTTTAHLRKRRCLPSIVFAATRPRGCLGKITHGTDRLLVDDEVLVGDDHPRVVPRCRRLRVGREAVRPKLVRCHVGAVLRLEVQVVDGVSGQSEVCPSLSQLGDGPPVKVVHIG